MCAQSAPQALCKEHTNTASNVSHPAYLTAPCVFSNMHICMDLASRAMPAGSLATSISTVLLPCRKRRPELRRRSFMDGGAMTWHGHMPYQATWTEDTRLVAFSVSSAGQGGLYCAFNTSHRPQTVTLLHWPGLIWQPIMDSGKVDTGFL